jgi:hypothetical protein
MDKTSPHDECKDNCEECNNQCERDTPEFDDLIGYALTGAGDTAVTSAEGHLIVFGVDKIPAVVTRHRGWMVFEVHLLDVMNAVPLGMSYLFDKPTTERWNKVLVDNAEQLKLHGIESAKYIANWPDKLTDRTDGVFGSGRVLGVRLPAAARAELATIVKKLMAEGADIPTLHEAAAAVYEKHAEEIKKISGDEPEDN